MHDPADTDMTHTLDPDDWQAFRERARNMLEDVLDHMEGYRESPVWNDPTGFQSVLESAQAGAGAEASDAALRALLPYGVGNTHPRFFGWVHGAGTPSGLMAEMTASALNANCGGRKHAAIRIERDIVDYSLRTFGLPETGSGLITSGTSMATFIALKTARDKAANFSIGETGLNNAPDLVGYASSGIHACFDRAFDMLGLGRVALRKLPQDENHRMCPEALKKAIAEDRAAGKTPFVICATAGSVNRGAIDDLRAIGEIAQSERIWYHVDAAFAAALQLSDTHRSKLDGIELSDSIGFDFHKWLQVNYDAGCVLIRDREDQLRAFSDRPDYLADAGRGLGSDMPWPVDFGPELSRGFRALKVWTQMIEFGPKKLAQIVDQNIEQAAYLAERVSALPEFDLLSYAGLNICCFRYMPEGMPDDALDTLNNDIVIALQEQGIAAPSTTRINGKLAIRVNITNHRTQMSDIDILIEAVAEIGAGMAADA